MPTGSSDVPPSRSARAAPASTHSSALGRLRVLEPQLEARVLARPRREARAGRLARPGAEDHARLEAGPDDRADARRGRHVRRDDLGAHAAGAERRRRVPDLEHAERLGVLDQVDERRRRVDARVGGVEAAGVGEQDEQVGAGQDRHLGGEEVVVAEGDLVGRRRVVLVDDRDDPPVEQLAQRAARVDVVRARAHVEERQEHLRRGQAAVAQQLVVDAVELALADGAGGLQVLDRARAERELEQPHAAGDRAGGDDHHVDALGVERGDLVADPLEHAGAQLTARLGDDGGSELDDEGGHGGLRDGARG